ncbi:MAG: NAD-dependent epimerase/dehydratase family protein [Syntrophobacteraceae bacterium]
MTGCSDNIEGLRCVVLGGGGFMGTNLCIALARRGARVQAFGRSRIMSAASNEVTWMSGLFDDPSAVARAIEGNNIVFHLIGSSTAASSNRDPIADLNSGAVNTVKMLDICRESGVRRVIFASSGGTIYGVPRSVPIREDHPAEPISAYGISRLAIEKYLSLYKYLHNLDYIVLRIANSYGRYQVPTKKQGVIAAMMINVLNGAPLEFWGTGGAVRDFIHVYDVVEAMIASIFYEGPVKVFNVGSGIGRSINEVAADIESMFPNTIAHRVYREARAADVPTNVLDISLIKQEMNWSPEVDWQAGLRDTADWLTDFLAARGAAH